MAGSGVRAFGSLLAMLAALGCSTHAGKPKPLEASIATERAAQQAFRAIRQQWSAGNRTDRAELEPKIRSFLATYPRDGQAALARAYLALVLVERGRNQEAHETAATVLSGPSGNAHDVADLAEAAVLLATQKHELAYERLLPLVGKMIDPSMRVFFDALMVDAATQSGRFYEAIAYMDVWLRDAQDQQSTVNEQVARALAAIPVPVLEQTLRTMEADRGVGGAGYGVAIRRALLARLAAIALERRDSRLAIQVVRSEAAPSGTNDFAESLQDLASSGAGATVDGRTIGMLLSAGTGMYGIRAAEVLSGAIDALHRQGRLGEGDRVRLVTREQRDASQTDLALAALTSQGAAILVAGLDPIQARAAVRFAKQTKTPLILLSTFAEPVTPRAPNTSPDTKHTTANTTTHDEATAPADSVFVLGVAESEHDTMLRQTLEENGARRVAAVGGSDGMVAPMAPPDRSARTVLAASCLAAVPQPGGMRFPVAAWKRAMVDGLLLLGDAPCASDFLREAAKGGLESAHAIVGLFGADVAFTVRPTLPTSVVSAGAFPLMPGDTASPLEAYRKLHGAPPTWSVLLGHDAVALARAALRALPLERTTDPIKVAALHKQSVDQLARAEAALWSTDARGFAGDRMIARKIQLRELAP